MEKALREKLAGGRFEKVAESDSRRMSAVRGKGNRSTEVILRMLLVRWGIRGWKMHPKAIPGKPDFYFPDAKVAVFTDGCFWHGCRRCGHIPKANNPFWAAKIERNRQRDAERKDSLNGMGIHSLRFWEHELKEDPSGCVVRLKRMVL